MGSTGPSTMRFTACALLGPVATRTMRRACMMEAMPMVSACVGTCSPSAKKRRLSRRVCSLRRTQ